MAETLVVHGEDVAGTWLAGCLCCLLCLSGGASARRLVCLSFAEASTPTTSDSAPEMQHKVSNAGCGLLVVVVWGLDFVKNCTKLGVRKCPRDMDGGGKCP